MTVGTADEPESTGVEGYPRLLDERIKLLRTRSADDDDPWLLVELAHALLDRYELRESTADDVRDLHEILHIGRAVGTVGNHPAPAALQAPVGAAHYYLFASTGERSHMDDAVAQLSRAVEAEPLDPQRLPAAVALAEMLLTRHDLADEGSRADLDAAAAVLTRVRRHPAVDPDLRTRAGELLGLALAETTGLLRSDSPELPALSRQALHLLEEARSSYGDAVAAAGLAQPIAEVHRRRFWMNPDGPEGAAELDAAIEEFAAAAGAGGDFALFFQLGDALDDRWLRSEDAADRDAAIHWLGRAREQPDGAHRAMAECRQMLGRLLLDRAQHGTGRTDLDAAVEHLVGARDALEPGDPTRARAVRMLANAHALRGGGELRPQDLLEIVAALRELVVHWPFDPAERAPVMGELALAILHGATRLYAWRPEHEEAVRLLTELHAELAPGDELHTVIAATLGLTLALRFVGRLYDGTSGDPDDAITLLENALARPDLDPAFAPACRAVLATTLALRASLLAAPRLGASLDLTVLDQPSVWRQPAARADLERALFHLDAVRASGPLAADPDTHGMWAFIRGVTVADTVDSLTDAELDELIDGFAAGVRGFFGDTFRTVGGGAVRGVLLGERARRDGRPEGVRRAIEVLREAERDLPSGSPLRPFVLGEIGRWLSVQRDGMGRREADSDALDALVDMVEMAGTHRPTAASALDRLADAVLAAHLRRPVGLRIGRVVRALQAGIADPPDDQGRSAIRRAALGLALASRWRTAHDRSDLDAAKTHLAEADRLAPPGHSSRLPVLTATAYARVTCGLLDADRTFLDQGIDGFAELLDLLTAGKAPADTTATAASVRTMLDRAHRFRMLVDDPEPVRTTMLELWTAAHLPDDHARRPAGADSRGGTAAGHRPGSAAEADSMIRRALTLTDSHDGPATGMVLDQAAALLDAALSVELPDESARPAYLARLGRILLDRHRLTGDRDVLERAVLRLEQSRTIASNAPPAGGGAAALIDLAVAYRIRGNPAADDGRRAANAGRGALREYAQAVLLSDTVAERLALARAANAELARLAGWCLDDADDAAAVVLLEAGRGLLLHAATMSATVPRTLRETGHETIADAWERNAADGAVRSRALDALAQSFSGLRLLAAPEAWALGSAAWAQGSDALVYLLPATPDGPGRAVVVRHEAVEHLDLPGLSTDDGGMLARYTAARRVLAARPDADEIDLYADPDGRRWLSTLDELCEWAWDAGIGPLLEHVQRWGLHRAPRLVLVPTGALGAVPWHAARRESPAGDRDGWRYACEDAVLSYAASGRLLGDAVRRTARPRAVEPAFVANPTGTQVWASFGAEAIRRAFYPGAAFLGHPRGDAPGTRDEVLGLMPAADRPGASLLQLSTHARAAEPPTRSRLYLAGGQDLTVEEILAQTSGRPQDPPGGLVICDACTTDLTEQDHDEALTLGTAFLAAGYASAIGTRWPVADWTTAILMFVFHHYLRDGEDTGPGEALRRTQLWALDRDRRAPAGMPQALTRYASDEKLADVYAWAAFAHHGR
jgi:hypothetical protein